MKEEVYSDGQMEVNTDGTSLLIEMNDAFLRGALEVRPATGKDFYVAILLSDIARVVEEFRAKKQNN